MNVYSLRTIADLGPGEHLCWLYEADDQHQEVITTLVRQGLERGEQVLHLACSDTIAAALGYLRDDGLDVDSLLTTAQLIMTPTDSPTHREISFDPDTLIAKIGRRTECALAEGYTALCLIEEMLWTPETFPGPESLARLEARLSAFLPDIKCLAICQYDRRCFPAEMLLAALRAHPTVIVGTTVYSNFYYTPLEELLAGGPSGLRLDRWLRNLEERSQTEKALQESERRYRTLFDNAGDAIFVHDLEGRILDVNRVACERLGYSREELLQMTPMDIDTPEFAPLVPTRVQEIRERGHAIFESAHVRKDGTVVPIELSSRIIEYAEMPAVLSIARDTTERKRANEAEREQRALTEALRDTAAALIGTLNLDEVLERILVNAERVVPHDAANIMLIESPGIARIVRSRGYAERGLEAWTQTQRFPIAKMPPLRKMAETFQPVHVADTSAYPDWIVFPETAWIRSHVGAPICIEGEVIGFLNLDSAASNVFGQTHADRLSAFANQAAVAIRNARLYEQAQHHTAQLEALRQATLSITMQLELDSLLEALVDNAVELLNAEGGGIYLHHQDRDVLEEVVSVRIPAGPDLECGEGLAGKVWEGGKPLFVANYSAWDGRSPGYEGIGFTAVIGVPICWGEEFLGVINLTADASRRIFSEDDARLLEWFAGQAAIAIQNAQLYRALEAYSSILEQAVTRRTAELRRTRDRAEAILNNSPDAILLLGEDGMVQTGNRAFSDLFGYDADEFWGRSPVDLVEARHAEALHKTLVEVVEEGAPARLEVIARRKDATIFDADVALAPVREENVVTGVVCSMRDISRLKELERLKDTFVANVSHELRTPIANLKLYHHLLGIRPEKRDAYMSTLRRETDRLERIVEDLLYLSRLDQGQMTPNRTHVDLNTLVDQYISDRMQLAAFHELTLTFIGKSDLPVVEADHELLERVLGVLLTNALDYTPAGGQVNVTTQIDDVGNTHWVGFSVRDTGIGIPPDEQVRLFERFFRGTAAYRFGIPGAGLGLSIAKEIVNRHGGRLEVSSEGTPGKGATFTVWLPVEQNSGSE